MRVLALGHLYPPHHLGGYEIACQGVLERLASEGHEVLVLTADVCLEGAPDEPDSPGGIEVRRVLRAWWDFNGATPRAPGMAGRLGIERHNQGALRRALADFRPDVASIWSMGFMSFSLPTILEARGVPIVLTLCDDWVCQSPAYDGWTRLFDAGIDAAPPSSADCGGRPARRHRLGRRPTAAALRVAGLETRLPTFAGATVSVLSHALARTIEGARWRFPGAPVVHLGVDTTVFPIHPPRSADPHDWKWRILYVGRVVAAKGVPTVVRAMAELPPQATLQIDGHAHPEEVRAVMCLAGELGVADRIAIGRSPRAELAARYAHADVVVFPSEWEEPFGMVPLEAMACGTPVVATGRGGSGEYLRDGENCVLFEAGDALGLARAVAGLARDPERRARISAGGVVTARAMTMDHFIDRVAELHSVAAKPRGIQTETSSTLPFLRRAEARSSLDGSPNSSPNASAKAASRACATGSGP